MNRISTLSLALVAALALSSNAEAKKKQEPKKGPPPAATAGKAPTVAVHKAPGKPHNTVAYAPPKQAQGYPGAGKNHGKPNATYTATQQRSVNQAYVNNTNVNKKNVNRANVNHVNVNRYSENNVNVNRTVERNYQTNNRVYNNNVSYYRPPVTVYRDWDRGREYHWNNHRYHWYNNAWVVLDVPTVAYSNGGGYGSVEADVQAALAREGYNPGPVDGEIGRQTRNAIAAYQDDHGIRPTGDINDALLRSLDLK